ncbi:MAG: Lrp/AsnC family transcriptional regulator [Firmicutes bacterium]|nr:Lrp/AsnC family transcriptional regulator [Bacillota bacterium]
MHLDNLDRELLNRIQHGFPVVPEPYKDLANQLDIMEEEVINRLRAMIDAGVIRRLGGIFDSRRVGYTGTLCALKVPEDKIESVAEVINEYSGITHNYLRDHEYNMWFTLLAQSTERIDQILDEIREKTKIEEILSLPASRIFKIKVNFKVTGESKC